MARPVKDAPKTTQEFAKLCRKVQQSLMLDLFGFKQGIEIRRFSLLWECPVGSAHSDLFAVLKWFRMFFHKHGDVLREIIKSSDVSPALSTRLHQAKVDKVEGEADAIKLRNNQKAGVTCDVKLTHALLAKLSERLQSAGQQAQRQWGQEGVRMFNEIQAGLREDLRQIFSEPEPVATANAISTRKKISRRGKK